MQRYRTDRPRRTEDTPTERMPAQAEDYHGDEYADRYDERFHGADHPHGERAYVEPRPDPSVLVVGKLTQTGYYLLGVLEGLLLLRLVFKLLGANPASPISQVVYGITQPFVAPFRDVVANPGTGQMVLEFTTIVAMLIYFLAYLAIAQLLKLFITPPKV